MVSVQIFKNIIIRPRNRIPVYNQIFNKITLLSIEMATNGITTTKCRRRSRRDFTMVGKEAVNRKELPMHENRELDFPTHNFNLICILQRLNIIVNHHGINHIAIVSPNCRQCRVRSTGNRIPSFKKHFILRNELNSKRIIKGRGNDFY